MQAAIIERIRSRGIAGAQPRAGIAWPCRPLLEAAAGFLDPENRNELNRRKQRERRTEGLFISSLSKTSVSSL
jgi:hypothetical protein